MLVASPVNLIFIQNSTRLVASDVDAGKCIQLFRRIKSSDVSGFSDNPHCGNVPNPWKAAQYMIFRPVLRQTDHLFDERLLQI